MNYPNEMIVSEKNEPPNFFILALIAFMFFSLSARVFAFLPPDMEVFTMFIEDLYCIRVEEDMNSIMLEMQEEDERRQRQEQTQRYEDKYLASIEKMSKRELTTEEVQGLINNYVVESTPLGDVMMRYNSVKESFEYYSDNTMPNRFLDVVARKYVKMYDCVSLYDVEKSENVPTPVPVPVLSTTVEPKENRVTSSVFAKFKTYNNGSSNKTPAPQNTVAKKNVPLKEVITSNRYTSRGKMVNMEMLKKVDRKIVDKTYGMSFAEYKQLKNR